MHLPLSSSAYFLFLFFLLFSFSSDSLLSSTSCSLIPFLFSTALSLACNDQLPADMCADLKSDGYCRSLPQKAAQFCAQTCGLCGAKPKPKPIPKPKPTPNPNPASGCQRFNHHKRKANVAIFVSSTLARKWARKQKKAGQLQSLVANALRSITIPAVRLRELILKGLCGLNSA